jgi:hypothetical protein
MAIEDGERLLVEIGQLLAEDREYSLDGTLLHAELDRNMVEPSIFKDRGKDVLYRDPDLERLGEALLDLWDAQETDDRWAEMEYVIRGGKFEVTYTYPDEIDPNEDPMERRDRIVRRHFGNKPIVYPPWPPEDSSLEYEL